MATRLLLAFVLAVASAAHGAPHFARRGWWLERTLDSGPGCDECGFGSPLLPLGRRVLVGQAYGWPGAVHLFDVLTGDLVRVFTPPGRPDGINFGYAFAVVGTRLVVGAPWAELRDDPTVSAPGLAYVFDLETGFLEHVLASPAGRSGGEFGVAAVASGPWVLIAERGAVHRFVPESGTLERTYAVPPIEGDPSPTLLAAFGPDVLVGGGATVHHLDGRTGDVVRTLVYPGDPQARTQLLAGVASVILGGPDGMYRFVWTSSEPEPVYPGYLAPLAFVDGLRILVSGPACEELDYPTVGVYLLDSSSGRRLAAFCVSDESAIRFPLAATLVQEHVVVTGPSEERRAVAVFAHCADGRRARTDDRLPAACADDDVPLEIRRRLVGADRAIERAEVRDGDSMLLHAARRRLRAVMRLADRARNGGAISRDCGIALWGVAFSRLDCTGP